jgi:hypothetical protein
MSSIVSFRLSSDDKKSEHAIPGKTRYRLEKGISALLSTDATDRDAERMTWTDGQRWVRTIPSGCQKPPEIERIADDMHAPRRNSCRTGPRIQRLVHAYVLIQQMPTHQFKPNGYGMIHLNAEMVMQYYWARNKSTDFHQGQ